MKEHGKIKGTYELDATGLEVIAAPSREYPISPKEHGTDFLMDNRHLWLRSKRQHAILRVRHTIIKAVRDFFDGRDFTLVDAPIFTPNACEGTSDALPDRLPRRAGVPHAVRAALHGGGGRRVRQGVLLRPDVPRREEQDAPPPRRVLDGRAGGRVHGPRRRHEARRGPPRVRRRARARDARARSSRSASATRRSSRT